MPLHAYSNDHLDAGSNQFSKFALLCRKRLRRLRQWRPRPRAPRSSACCLTARTRRRPPRQQRLQTRHRQMQVCSHPGAESPYNVVLLIKCKSLLTTLMRLPTSNQLAMHFASTLLTASRPILLSSRSQSSRRQAHPPRAGPGGLRVRDGDARIAQAPALHAAGQRQGRGRVPGHGAPPEGKH